MAGGRREGAAQEKARSHLCRHCSRLATQAVGTPVVTTRLGAMADFSLHGESVPFAQRAFLVQGFVATPDVAGTAAALERVADGVSTNQTARAAAQAYIEAHMSTAAVVDALGVFMRQLMSDSEIEVEYTTVRYGTASVQLPPNAAEFTVIHSDGYALDARAVRFHVAQAPATLEGMLLLNLELNLETAPDTERPMHEWGNGPTVLTRTRRLRAALAASGGSVSIAVSRLLAASSDGSPRTSAAGVAAVRIPLISSLPPPARPARESGRRRRRKGGRGERVARTPEGVPRTELGEKSCHDESGGDHAASGLIIDQGPLEDYSL